ncbi:MAG TPA: NAD(P)/FAD-dependent oxidoreductase [Trebonia sp.]|nr:NAD(P)/FAD-dependent oxidoreductase [Trebonia sp.]
MDTRTSDVVVVGARCAGAPIAMLLARAGLSVRLVERSARLGDVVSGHLIKPPGVARLRRWTVLDAVLATGCPRLDDRTLWLGGEPHRAPAPEPAAGPIAPRRTVLDPILLTAAADAGADVEMGVSADGLLRDGGRVTGVTTSAGQRRARLVIGADGRNSRIARLAGAETYHDHPPVTFAYYTYWRGCPVAGVHAWLEPGRFFGIFPVGGGLALAFVQAPRGEYQAFRRDPLMTYVRELRSRPGLADLLGEAVMAERLRGTAALPTFFRRSSGPGWVLAGDAGHHKDPVIARGIADAFRDADLLTSAIVDHWNGDLDAALAEYERQRDRCAIPLSDANLAIARLDLPAEALGAAWFEMNALETALDDPAAISDAACSRAAPALANIVDRCAPPGVLNDPR